MTLPPRTPIIKHVRHGRCHFTYPGVGVALMIFTASQGAPANAESPLSLLLPGVQFAEEVRDTTKTGWYGLIVVDSTVTLQAVTIGFKDVPYRRDHQGIEITTGLRPEPLFLLRGLENPQEGDVDTWFIGEARLSHDETLALTHTDNRYELQTGPPVPFENVEGHTNAFTYEVILKDRATSRSQTIGKWFVGTPAAIQWVGDIDRDGMLDLFLYDDTSESGEASWTLLLSSRATSDQLVGLAAWFHRPGC
jgi:hypothetical protein